jgi:hypothetical protein
MELSDIHQEQIASCNPLENCSGVEASFRYRSKIGTLSAFFPFGWRGLEFGRHKPAENQSKFVIKLTLIWILL